MQAQVPMVPIVLRNVGEVMWRGAQVLSPGTIEVAVLPAVDTAGWSAATIGDHVADVRGMFLDTLDAWPGEGTPKGAPSGAQAGRQAGGDGRSTQPSVRRAATRRKPASAAAAARTRPKSRQSSARARSARPAPSRQAAQEEGRDT